MIYTWFFIFYSLITVFIPFDKMLEGISKNKLSLKKGLRSKEPI